MRISGAFAPARSFFTCAPAFARSAAVRAAGAGSFRKSWPNFPFLHSLPWFGGPLRSVTRVSRLPCQRYSIPHPMEHREQDPSSILSCSGTGLRPGVFSVSAPTGQAETHWPQEMQVLSSPKGTPNDGATTEANPLWM